MGLMALEMNPHFERAWKLMETSDRHLFITGKAGTGKSTLLEHFRAETKKNIAVLAPTGVAAVNVRGQTIHSFFGFRPDITPSTVQRANGKTAAVLKKLDAIVIDEISMVRSDLLDCIDKLLRLSGHDKYAPFGGIQMIFIGDLYQLPPVVTQRDKEVLARQYASPYFFDANVFACLTLDVIELQTIYRQSDEQFIDLLNSVRTNTSSHDHLAVLNQRLLPIEERDIPVITLATTNALADGVNTQKLDSLAGNEFVYEGTTTGNFTERDCPCPKELVLKIGAQVMLLNNDPARRWVNGTIGMVTRIVKSEDPENADVIIIRFEDGRQVEVLPHTWEAYEFVAEGESQTVTSRSVGTFTQYPLKLAWAVTIHKSQGKTFDHVIIDIGRGTFAHGQLYVALSRCRSLQGITLKQPIQRRHILMDQRVLQFMGQFNESGHYRGVDAFDQPQSLF